MRADLLVAGKYRLVRELGAGAMGVVWLARNELVDREFAIKFLHPATPKSDEVFTRFFQEAKILGRLRHPSLLEIVDTGKATELHDAPYLVMELLEGIALDGAIRGMGRLPLPLTLLIMQEVARALALAHDRGIVHRDLKPANIFLHRPGNGALIPKVVDFGISKIIAGPGDDPALSLTRTGAMLGSPMYMSPEQAASDKTLDARSDVHALGVVTWECLVGKTPYVATTFTSLMVEIVTGSRPLLRASMPDAPASVEALLAKAFAVDRDARFANAGEFAAAIVHVLAQLGVTETLDARTSAELFFSKLPKDAAVAAVAPPYVSRRKRSGIGFTQVDPFTPTELLTPTITAHLPHERSAPAQKKSSALPYAIVGAVIAVLAGGNWYLAGKRTVAPANGEDLLVAPPAIPPPTPTDPPVVDAGAKNSPRPPKPARPPAGTKGDFRRGVSGDGF